jgi:LysM repeat protein
MKSHVAVIAIIALLYAAFLVAAPRTSIVSAEPRAQSTIAPTEEPTKRPYVFPTPIFIPTYADDTPVPRSTPGATSIPLQPGVDTYTVQSGDSPWLIAQKVYGDGTKYKLIMDANGMTDQTKLRVGTVLKIPSVPGIVAPPVLTLTMPPEPTSLQPGIIPTSVPTSTALPAPTSSPTPTPVSSVMNTESISTILNLVSALLFVAAIICGVLAYWRYARLRQLERLTSPNQPIRIKQ